MGLFQHRSVVVLAELTNLVRFVTKESSVQATIPWTCIPQLEGIVAGGIDNLHDSYTSSVRTCLDSKAGQPVVAHLLDKILALFKANGDLVRDDCVVVLNFLGYLCQNVVLSYLPDARLRLRARLQNEGWPQCEVQPPSEEGFGQQGSGVREGQGEGGGGGGEYDYLRFLQSGQHFPNWITIQPRGVFKKDRQAKSEETENSQGCPRTFSDGKKSTGGLSPKSRLLQLH